MQPKKRSGVRIALGRLFYSVTRFLSWYLSGTKFASRREDNLYPISVFLHKTPLIRKLKDVEMWMQYNKVKNLRLAIQKINQIVLYPGETLSYWKVLGKPTRQRGYVAGMVLFYGGFRPGIGGGLCQLSNLIYWMTLHTPLMVIERYRHSYDIFPDAQRTQPFGSGATCSYNYIDLQIKNTTNQPYQLHVYLTEDHLAGEWRAIEEQVYVYEIYEKHHWITHEAWGGYVRHNVIYRRKYDKNHQCINDEYVAENHAIMMYQPLLPTGTAHDQ
jgi:vancomycin resistance protein VanW